MAISGACWVETTDRIDANGLVPVVLDRHLTLSVRGAAKAARSCAPEELGGRM